MTQSELLVDAFERLRDAVYPALNGLSLDQLAYRPDGASNSIAWLAWHLTRVQDRGVAALSGMEPVWAAGGWFDRSGLALEPTDAGYGHDAQTVGAVLADASFLLDYFEDVHQRTVTWIRSLDAAELSRVVDDKGLPPVTVESSLLGVLVDDLQHVGQAAYVRGLVHHR